MEGIALDENKVRESNDGRRAPDPNELRVTLVAFLGTHGPQEFNELVRNLLALLGELLGKWIERDWVKPVDERIAHATFIGLEAYAEGGKLLNVNLLERLKGSVPRDDVPPMDLGEIVRLCRRLPLPMRVRFGGFDGPGTHVNPYAGRAPERQPYARSFSIKKNGQMVAIGWPVHHRRDSVLVPTLVGLRHAFERSAVVHKYHRRPMASDNDLFFLLAEVTPKPWEEGTPAERTRFRADLAVAQQKIRDYMAAEAHRVTLNVDEGHLQVVKYLTPDLAGDIKVYPLDEVDEDLLRTLYLG